MEKNLTFSFDMRSNLIKSITEILTGFFIINFNFSSMLSSYSGLIISFNALSILSGYWATSFCK